MKLTAILFLQLLVISPPLIASSSWGSPFTSYVVGKYWNVKYNWGITSSDEPDNNPVICADTTCLVFPGTRSGLGRAGVAGTCDAGGLCNARGIIYNSTIPYIKVPAGTTWESAYTQFVAAHGPAGDVDSRVLTVGTIPPPDHPTWGILCVGFASLPLNGEAISNLAPSTSCGLISPPDTVCEIETPPEIDLGSVPTGNHSLVSDSAAVSVVCSAPATVTASLTTDTHKLAGVPLSVTLGGVQLSVHPKSVFSGTTGGVPLVVAASGTFSSPGAYTEAVPIVFSYY